MAACEQLLFPPRSCRFDLHFFRVALVFGSPPPVEISHLDQRDTVVLSIHRFLRPHGSVHIPEIISRLYYSQACGVYIYRRQLNIFAEVRECVGKNWPKIALDSTSVRTALRQLRCGHCCDDIKCRNLLPLRRLLQQKNINLIANGLIGFHPCHEKNSAMGVGQPQRCWKHQTLPG